MVSFWGNKVQVVSCTCANPFVFFCTLFVFFALRARAFLSGCSLYFVCLSVYLCGVAALTYAEQKKRRKWERLTPFPPFCISSLFLSLTLSRSLSLLLTLSHSISAYKLSFSPAVAPIAPLIPDFFSQSYISRYSSI